MMGSHHEILREGEGHGLVCNLIKALWQICGGQFGKCQGWRQKDQLEKSNQVLNLNHESIDGEEEPDLRNFRKQNW